MGANTQNSNTSTSSQTICVFHTDHAAKYYCPRCGNFLCENCVRIKEVADVRLVLCPHCKDTCRSVKTTAPQPSDHTFSNNLLIDPFIYPFRGQGVFLLLGYAIFLIIMNFLSLIPLVGFILYFVAMAYLGAFCLNVISSSAGGERELPDWPDISDWKEDVIRPWILMLGTKLMCFGPAIVYSVYSGFYTNNQELPTYPTWILAGAGAFYFPMAILAVTMYESLTAANPILVFRSIFRILPAYLLIITLLVFVVLLIALTSSIPHIGHILGKYVLGLYFLMVLMRLIGLIYHNNQKKLHWFEN